MRTQRLREIYPPMPALALNRDSAVDMPFSSGSSDFFVPSYRRKSVSSFPRSLDSGFRRSDDPTAESRLNPSDHGIIPYGRSAGGGAVIAMLIAGAPNMAWAQVGFHPSPLGVTLFFILPPLLLGLVICGTGYLFYRKPWVFIFGCALIAPALALLAFGLIRKIRETIPRTESWDFSADRSVARLRGKPDAGDYYYRGNIRSTVKLPENRQWSGKASRVTLAGNGGEIGGITWQGRTGSLEDAYREAKRILGELGFSVHELDGWYDRVRRIEGDKPSYVRDESGNPEISVVVTGYQQWAVEVHVAWKQAGR